MTEYCPRCNYELTDVTGDDRSCQECGFYGDATETMRKLPDSGELNLTRAAIDVLKLYRDICRKEVYIEQMYDAGNAAECDIRNVTIQRQGTVHSMVEMFLKLRNRLPLVLTPENGMIPWPEDWTDYHFNACNEHCDMLVGPCACGGWHSASEGWVRNKLEVHGAIIHD